VSLRDGDEERHNWWCGFTEALNEVIAKIEEIDESTGEIQGANEIFRR